MTAHSTYEAAVNATARPSVRPNIPKCSAPSIACAATTAIKMPSAEKTEPIGRPPVRYSEPAAISVAPKPEAKNLPEPLPPMPGAPPWRHPLGT